MLRVQRLQRRLGEEILNPDHRLLVMSARLRGLKNTTVGQTLKGRWTLSLLVRACSAGGAERGFGVASLQPKFTRSTFCAA